MMRSAHTGKQLGVSRISTSRPDGTPSHTLKRADLYQALHDQATSRGIGIQHGKRLVNAETTGAGVRAVFADGSDATGDLLIGCDGVHSAVRRIIDPAAPAPTYAGLVGTGGYARGVDVDAERGSYTMIFGKRAFFGYPVAPDGEVCWFGNVPRPVAAPRPAGSDKRRPPPGRPIGPPKQGPPATPSARSAPPAPPSHWPPSPAGHLSRPGR